MPQIRIPVLLRSVVGGQPVVQATGTRLRDVIHNVDRAHQGFAAHVLDGTTGELLRFVNVYVNDEDVRYLQGLDTPVAEADVISILPAVAGGDESTYRATTGGGAGGNAD